MKIIEKNCLQCNKLFNAEERYVKRGQAKFCSRSCSSKYSRNKISSTLKPNVFCSFCGKWFYKNECQKICSRSGLYFCCRKHKDLSQKIGGIKEIMPQHYGTGTGISTYREFAISNKGNACERCGWNKHIAGIVVHHKDRNRENQSLDNLEVICACCHAIEHWAR